MKRLKFRHLGILLILSFALMGYTCESNMVSVLGSMAAGDGVGYMLNKRAPGAVEDCEKAFDKLMQDTAGIDPIPSENMIRYYNESLGIIARQVNDPYYVTSYLGAMMTELGAQYSTGPDPQMVGIQPVPRNLMLAFENGYDIGKRRWLERDN